VNRANHNSHPSTGPIELVIFDCDGTLVDSETLVAEVTAECARSYGIPITAAEALARFKGGRMADCVRDLEALRGEPLPASFVTEVRERQNIVLRERLQPMEGAVELLQAMHLPYCMASNGLRAKMEVTLGVTGLLHFFQDRIFSAYEVNSWKPDPELFLHAARHFGVEPARCAVIEDSMPGILAGIAARMQVFALLDHGSNEPVPAEVCVIRSLYDLQEHLIVPERRVQPASSSLR
jgi:HAD superfamily hydrolase (TIGR01509 family)